jgi:hypothetical protein
VRAAQLPDELEMLLEEDRVSVSTPRAFVLLFVFDTFILQIFAPALRACIAGSDIQVLSFAETSEEVVCGAVDNSVHFMKQRLLQAHRKLKNVMRAKAKIQEETDKQPNKKFSIREMSTGSIDDFHEGLHDRIGEAFLPSSFKSAGAQRPAGCCAVNARNCFLAHSQDHPIWIFSKPCARSM